MKPITGVIYFNELVLELIADESYIDLSFEAAFEEEKKKLIQKIKSCKCIDDIIAINQDIPEDMDNFVDEYECQDHEEYSLYGSWKQNKKGKWYPDKNGEYSAICRDGVLQVVWSAFNAHCRFCSPCYPNQGDLSHKDNYGVLTYDMPPQYWPEKENQNADNE